MTSEPAALMGLPGGDGCRTVPSAGFCITAGQRVDGVRPSEAGNGRSVRGPSHSVPAASSPQVKGWTDYRPATVHDPLRTDRPPLKGDGTKGGIRGTRPNTVPVYGAVAAANWGMDTTPERRRR